MCQSQKGEGRAFTYQKKKKICVDELLRSGILVKIMAQIYECEVGRARRLESATILIRGRSPTV